MPVTTTDSHLSFEVEFAGNCTRVWFSGAELDETVLEMLIGAVEVLLRSRPETDLLLDMGRVRHVSGGAMSALLRLAGSMERHGKKLKLCGVDSDLYGALELTRLLQRFEFGAMDSADLDRAPASS